jgi:hypothetical protein
VFTVTTIDDAPAVLKLVSTQPPVQVPANAAADTVGIGVGVAVAVLVGVAVAVGVCVAVLIEVEVGVGVCVAVLSGVEVGVEVLTVVAVGVGVETGGVGVGVAVEEGPVSLLSQCPAVKRKREQRTTVIVSHDLRMSPSSPSTGDYSTSSPVFGFGRLCRDNPG